MLLTIDDVQRAAIAYYTDLEPGWIVSRKRERRLSWPRHVAMNVARKVTIRSLPQIASKFGGIDHTSALHAIRATERRIQTHPDIARAVEAITELAYRRADFRAERAMSNSTVSPSMPG